MCVDRRIKTTELIYAVKTRQISTFKERLGKPDSSDNGRKKRS